MLLLLLRGRRAAPVTIAVKRFVVPYESRASVPATEIRTATISSQSRSFNIPGELRRIKATR